MGKIFKCFQINIIRNFSDNMGVIFSLIIMPLVVFAAFYATNLPNATEKIAVIGESETFIQYLDKNQISYDKLKALPEKQDIYMRNYSGVIKKQNGKVTVISYKGSQYRRELQLIAKKKYSSNKEKNDSEKFPNAFYLSMSILLVQAVLNMRLFVNDRTNDTSKRLRVIGIKNSQYLSSHLLFNWVALFIPFGLVNVICNRLFFGSSMIEDLKVILISFIVTGLFSALAVLICTLVKDNGSAIMVGNIVACFTVLLSGMFGNFHNKILKAISQSMPQKISFNWVNEIFHRGDIVGENFLLILIMFTVSMLFAVGFYNRSNQ
ncbi:TPA: ABC transporter permease [Streptococcus agalactiae]|nr:ABC transporter permease [Streptococcus agalactiae]